MIVIKNQGIFSSMILMVISDDPLTLFIIDGFYYDNNRSYNIANAQYDHKNCVGYHRIMMYKVLKRLEIQNKRNIGTIIL